MKKIAFFPFHNDLRVIHPYAEHLDGYQIVGFSSFREDLALIDGLNKLYNIPGKDLDELLDECDILVILDDDRSLRKDKYYDVLDKALAKGVELLISPIAAVQLDLAKYEGRYTYLHKGPPKEDIICPMYANYKPDTLYSIDVPVISVLGVGKCCGKFECQLFTAEVLAAQYKATVVSSNPLGALFGYYTMPAFLYGAIPFEEKIFAFNCYIKMIIQQETPEAIILGIPEGVSFAQKREFNHFSEYPLVITSAISIDIAIFCMYFVHGELIDAGLAKVMEYCSNHFAVPVGAIFLSNMHYEMPQEDFSPIIYEPLDNRYLDKYYPDIASLKTPIFGMRDKASAKRVIEEMIKPLQNNLPVI